jgi:hypothetical protein
MNLYEFHVFRCRTFCTLRNIKTDTLAFTQRLKTFTVNSTVMNKHVTTVVLFNEYEALTFIKSFHFAF